MRQLTCQMTSQLTHLVCKIHPAGNTELRNRAIVIVDDAPKYVATLDRTVTALYRLVGPAFGNDGILGQPQTAAII